MAEDWTARGSLAGLDIEIRGGRADDAEYLVLAVKGAPSLERALAQGLPPALAPFAWPMVMNPWLPWFELWRAAWAPWIALALPPRTPPAGDRP